MIKNILFEQQKEYQLHKVILEYKIEKNIVNRNKNYNNSNKTKLNKLSVSNIRDIAFCGCSEIIQTRNSTILPCLLQIIDKLRRLFIFSNYIGQIDHFTLELLKRSDT